MLGLGQIIEESIFAVTQRRDTSKSKAKQLSPLVRVANVNDGVPYPKGIPGLARHDLRNPSYVRELVKTTIEHWAPTYRLPEGWRFEVIPVPEGGFVIDKQFLDFSELTQAHQYSFPSSDTKITPGLLLATIVDVRANLFFAARESAELMTDDLYSSLITKWITHTSGRFKKVKQFDQVSIFQDELVEGPTIRDTINKRWGKRTSGKGVAHAGLFGMR